MEDQTSAVDGNAAPDIDALIAELATSGMNTAAFARSKGLPAYKLHRLGLLLGRVLSSFPSRHGEHPRAIRAIWGVHLFRGRSSRWAKKHDIDMSFTSYITDDHQIAKPHNARGGKPQKKELTAAITMCPWRFSDRP